MTADDSTTTGPDGGLWTPFALDDVATLMAPLGIRWWFTGGVALELHLGRSWRDHHDIDVGVCRQDVPQLRPLLDSWRVVVAAKGRLARWDGRDLSAADHENNLRVGRADGSWCLDIVVGDGDADEWVYRRDPRLRLPWERAVLRTATGLAYLAPTLQLLFKSKSPRPQDHADAEEVMPTLDRWSMALLDSRLPPDHAWRPLIAAHPRGVTGDDVDEDDWLDVLHLHERFGLPIPADYDSWRGG